jgi:hypothetical protein
MIGLNSQSEKPEKERRYDPDLLKKGLRCDLDQYEMLKRCSDKNDMTEWNEWREANKGIDIYLEGAHLKGYYLQDANLFNANLKKAMLDEANLQRSDLRMSYLSRASLLMANLENAKIEHADLKHTSLSNTSLRVAQISSASLEGAAFCCADIENANFCYSNLKGAIFDKSKLDGVNFQQAVVDGNTSIWKPSVSLYSKKKKFTNFEGVSLSNVRIDPGTKQLLEYNIRRMNWEEWYKEHRILRWPVCWFWSLSDYGLRTWRIILWFFGLAVVFAVIYRLWPSFVMVYGKVGDIRGFWHALYFSVVTMTTLGFGDIAANPDSWAGQTLLMIQVILGYVLLGALVTRFAVLFTAGGPAGKFADEKEKTQKIENISE